MKKRITLNTPSKYLINAILVAVLLIGYTDENADAVSGASSRDSLELKTTMIR